eukprot:CAMPEP_0177432206 /NCGR_PEP_ID=MMETSP0368-20130122/76576_1 /TAXON_ID=447022 ORGANISM="Scrippsiella hangoei-like, Strain SHHI-4" /NCGR_SAMPLE_ID=MMETSP0368 /ASSEMBLY_ACC=CAM_ASM_000363 /LENGTH=147 /DNA_ID=CAMNT_0018902871 /DNA_START=13 /DNA_END=453 /DNA_ORIENTATION=-
MSKFLRSHWRAPTLCIGVVSVSLSGRARGEPLVNDAPAHLWDQVEAVLDDPRLRGACPSCDPLPRDWPEACVVLSLDPPVLPWYLASGQQPDKYIGNYLSNFFFAYAAAVARGAVRRCHQQHRTRRLQEFLPLDLAFLRFDSCDVGY